MLKSLLQEHLPLTPAKHETLLHLTACTDAVQHVRGLPAEG